MTVAGILNKRKNWIEAGKEVERQRERIIEEEGYEYVNDDELNWDEVTIANYEWIESVIKFFEEVFDASLDQSGGGSAYLTIYDDPEEHYDWIKIRVADHPQKYDADYSIELTDEMFWKDNLDMAIEASKKIKSDE